MNESDVYAGIESGKYGTTGIIRSLLLACIAYLLLLFVGIWGPTGFITLKTSNERITSVSKFEYEGKYQNQFMQTNPSDLLNVLTFQLKDMTCK